MLHSDVCVARGEEKQEQQNNPHVLSVSTTRHRDGLVAKRSRAGDAAGGGGGGGEARRPPEFHQNYADDQDKENPVPYSNNAGNTEHLLKLA